MHGHLNVRCVQWTEQGTELPVSIVNQGNALIVGTGSVSLQFLNATRQTKGDYTIWPLGIRLYIPYVTLDMGGDSSVRPLP